LAPFLGGLWAYTMFINPFSATILLSILLGVLFKGKIDNIAHLSGIIVIFPIIFLLGIDFLFIPLIFLVLSAVVDEIGNDYIASLSADSMEKKWSQFMIYFFDQRWLLKTSILFLSFIGIIPFYFFITMICFDYSYLAVRLVSEIKQGKQTILGQLEVKVKSLLNEKNLSKN